VSRVSGWRRRASCAMKMGLQLMTANLLCIEALAAAGEAPAGLL